ncbi:MAG TPA: cytidylate kinase-like family protein [Candidatus Alectryocaccomicrobium excrementavium]|uniref:Cytidylate kinase-like family protein n=1 Tax=Candidatus Alectryocaccomicrobium excrementavium TaxID=2840668 RepID=A0A9D1FY56_9FIRM|nr:cytidylate kinase-like family protein [Candidatus Alectryocaccomicrobium excrementavium]
MKIITISREFGSGGRSIAKAVADKLGIAYYDKELVRQVATETGYAEEFVEQKGEYAPTSNWLTYAFSQRSGPNMPHMLSADDFLWAIQRKVILELADKGPCLIVGRCADFILMDRTDCLNVFIHANMQTRAQHVLKLYGNSETPIEKRLEDKDKRRRLYYKRYTGRDWGMAQNYHLSLDSGVIGEEQCRDIICSLYQAL